MRISVSQLFIIRVYRECEEPDSRTMRKTPLFFIKKRESKSVNNQSSKNYYFLHEKEVLASDLQ